MIEGCWCNTVKSNACSVSESREKHQWHMRHQHQHSEGNSFDTAQHYIQQFRNNPRKATVYTHVWFISVASLLCRFSCFPESRHVDEQVTVWLISVKTDLSTSFPLCCPLFFLTSFEGNLKTPHYKYGMLLIKSSMCISGMMTF